MTYKFILCAAFGVIGSFFVELFGAWSTALTILLICMGLDYVTGLVLAGVFHKSPKSETGSLDSNIGWKGLFRKGGTLIIILVAHFVELLTGLAFVRDAVVLAFALNEIVSIIENCGLMGVPVPAAMMKAINVLRLRVKAAEADMESEAARENPEQERVEEYEQKYPDEEDNDD